MRRFIAKRASAIAPALLAAMLLALGSASPANAEISFEEELFQNCEADGKELILEDGGFACCFDIKGTDGKTYQSCTVCKDNGECKQELRPKQAQAPGAGAGTTKAPPSTGPSNPSTNPYLKATPHRLQMQRLRR